MRPEFAREYRRKTRCQGPSPARFSDAAAGAFAPAAAAPVRGSPESGRARSTARHDRSPTFPARAHPGAGRVAYTKSTSDSDRRATCETMCVPGGSGFAEFQNTSDSHASSSIARTTWAPRATRDGAAGAGEGVSDMAVNANRSSLPLPPLSPSPLPSSASPWRPRRASNPRTAPGVRHAWGLCKAPLRPAPLRGDRGDALLDLLELTAQRAQSAARS